MADAEQAKKLTCHKEVAPDEACGAPSMLTLRVETDEGPEYMCFCRVHLPEALGVVKMLMDGADGMRN